ARCYMASQTTPDLTNRRHPTRPINLPPAIAATANVSFLFMRSSLSKSLCTTLLKICNILPSLLAISHSTSHPSHCQAICSPEKAVLKKPVRPGDKSHNGRGLLHDGVASASIIYTDWRGIAV